MVVVVFVVEGAVIEGERRQVNCGFNEEGPGIRYQFEVRCWV